MRSDKDRTKRRSDASGDLAHREENKMAILTVSGVSKIYTSRFGTNKVQALDNVSFEVNEGEYVAVMG